MGLYGEAFNWLKGRRVEGRGADEDALGSSHFGACLMSTLELLQPGLWGMLKQLYCYLCLAVSSWCV